MAIESERNTDCEGGTEKGAGTRRRKRWRPGVVIVAGLSIAVFVGLNWPYAYVVQSYSKLPEGVSGVSGATLHTAKQHSSGVEYVAGFPWVYRTRPETSTSQWRPQALFADGLVGFGAVTCLLLWWRSRPSRWYQVNLTDFLLVVSVGGAALAYWRSCEQEVRREEQFSELTAVQILGRELRYPRWWEACWDKEWIRRYERATAALLEDPDKESMLALAKRTSIDTVVISRGELTTDDLLLLTKLPNLRWVVLQAPSEGVDIATVLQSLPRLESVELSYMRLEESDFIALESHPAVRQLVVGRSAFAESSLRRIARLPNLELLCLPDFCLEFASLSCLKEHPSLRELTFRGGWSDENAKARRLTLENLPRLEVLQLPRCVDRVVLEDLPCLRTVWSEPPRATMVTLDTRPSGLSDRESPQLPARLEANVVQLKNLPSIKAISLNPFQLTDLHLEGMPNLTRLVLSGRLSRNTTSNMPPDQPEACIVKAYQQCPSLRALEIRGLHVDEAMLQIIENCQSLSHLILVDACCHQAAVERIARLPTLLGLTVLQKQRLRPSIPPQVGLWCPLALDLTTSKLQSLQLIGLSEMHFLQLPHNVTSLCLADLPELRSNLVLKGRDFRHLRLQDLPKVRLLDLRDCTADDAEISGLRGLKLRLMEGADINER